jgi:2-oxoisovalerate dehydrogenase E2 component (dihydrolipoyl transacylase)
MPVARKGEIVVRRIMNVSSSFDHRIVDGANGAALVQSLKRILEHPAMIFM